MLRGVWSHGTVQNWMAMQSQQDTQTVVAVPQVVAPVGNPPSNASDATALFIVSIMTLVAAGIWAWYTERKRRSQGRVETLMMQEQQRAMELNRTREDTMFEQHKQMNELTIAKLRMELKLMESQFESMAATDERRSGADAFNRQMMEKAKLEVESLKLHIREQRKRLDDYGQYE